MSERNRLGEGDDSLLARMNQRTGRREFLKWSGVGAVALVATGCDREHTRTITETLPPDTVRIVHTDTVAPARPATVTIDLSNDFGVLNFAFALEQLEAAFYTTVASSFYSGISAQEQRVLTDLRDHEVVHRDFLRAAIGALGGTAIGNLTPDFSAVNFTSRTSVLTTARIFEDLGVAAYNGAAQFLKNPLLLGVAGKIVSVEARHASAIRDLLNPRSGDFAPSAFDAALPPPAVAAAAQPFIRNLVTLSNVPTFTPSANRS